VKFFKLILIVFHMVELFFQVVEKQLTHDFHYIFLRGIMSTKIMAFFGVHYTLKHATKNSRRDLAPIQRATLEKYLPHIRIKICNVQGLFKQLSVYIKKFIQFFVDIFRAFILGSVERLEQPCNPASKIAPIFSSSILN